MEIDPIIDTYLLGVYYNPASNHYNNNNNSTNSTNIIITCNRCKLKPLSICIGYRNYDLCLKCVQELDVLHKKHQNSIVLPDLKFSAEYTPYL
jgi:hypothetical protein